MFKRFFNWLRKIFGRKKQEVVVEEAPVESEVVDEDAVDIIEYSPDIFEIEEEELFEEQQELEQQVRELKKTKEEALSIGEILDHLSSEEDIFQALGADDFWNATGYCDTIREKFNKARADKDEEQQLKHFWHTNKMYMRSVEAYRDAIARSDMLRARVMLLNIRMLYDVLIEMHRLNQKVIPKPQTLDVEMRKEYVKDILVEILEKNMFPLSIKEILSEVMKGERKSVLELLTEESIQFYIQSLVDDEFIKRVERIIEYAPPPLPNISPEMSELIPEKFYEDSFTPDVKMYRREDIGREELSALFPPEIYKGLQEKGFYRIEDVQGKLDELQRILLEELQFEPDMTTISIGILSERLGRLDGTQQTVSNERSLLDRRRQELVAETVTAVVEVDEDVKKESAVKGEEFHQIVHQDIINSPIPRPYQLEAYYMFKGEHYNASIIDSPTGSGKTLMGMMCIQDFLRTLRKGESILIVVPTQNYQSQWVDSLCFNEIGLQISPTFVFSGTITQLENFITKTREIPPIIILTYTSLAQILGAKTKKEKELKVLINWLGIRSVIFDEAHKVVEQESSATYEVTKRIVKLYKGAHIENLIGFSGTAKAYEKAFKRLGLKLIYVVPEKELVLHGFVAPIAELGVTFAYSGREKAIREIHNEIKVNMKQIWSYFGYNNMRREFQKIPMNDRLFICKELLGMYQSYRSDMVTEKLKAKFADWAPSREKGPLTLSDANLVQAVQIYNGWSDISIAYNSTHTNAAREIVEETEQLIMRLEQLIRIPSLRKMITSKKYGKRMPRRQTFYNMRKESKDRRESRKKVRDTMCSTMVGVYKALDTWARTKIGEGRVGTLQSIINAEEDIRDVKGVVIFDRGRTIKIEDETGIGSPGFSGVGGSFAQSLGTDIIKYNPIAVQSSEMYISYNPDLERPLQSMMADFIRNEVIVDKLTERLFLELIYELPFQEQLSNFIYLTFRKLMTKYASTLKKVFRARYGEFARKVFNPMSEFIDEMVILDENLAMAVNLLKDRIDDPSIRINNIVLMLFDYAIIARKIEYASKRKLESAAGEILSYYSLPMPSGRQKQLIYDLVSDFIDSELLPIQLVFVSSWARTGWDVRTPDILIDATATRDVTAWQQLRGRAMRALESWTIDCYRTIAILLGKRGSSSKIIQRLPPEIQKNFTKIQKEFAPKEEFTPIMIELLIKSIDEAKIPSEDKIQLKTKLNLGNISKFSTTERMKLIIYLMLSQNKVAHIFEMVKASGSTRQVEYDKRTGIWRRKAAIAKKHREEPILPVPGSKRSRGKYIAPLIYAKDPTADTPTEIRSTLSNLLDGLDQDLLDDWVLSLIEESDTQKSVTVETGDSKDRETLEAIAREEALPTRYEIDGVTEEVLKDFLSEIDEVEF
ncbi:MAG: DEAD/DEAH box helicase family protein [Candidatus Heimdallarchaeota archaeon]|nr:DEAD/DEAH box helicase family protein [Candidatus Heimdallarchaeota archaeon]MCK4290530.1 DEAD/DEAH box helicase family protein [Candidatus Heimdallarchaeota archaeon]